ncbi:MAG TPA: FAD-dependent oxidoreductase [Deltaproteobacteria bacterium]|jgi:pyruvate/2-oxoglutarate dehydrogenase complex dihydrolipoamide dehydrogenase (E3) component|nr:FAD-dependent oxidoreductase [Deltaproteobacteria bacterium]
MIDTYDVIVLGAGPAGRAVSIITRRSGASVLIVEANGFGGTCPLRGCIPKKDNRTQTIQSDAVANVTGRIADIDGLELGRAGVATDRKVSIIHADHSTLSKVLIDSRNNRIVGAHVLGHDASEIINIFALAMKYKITSRDLHEFVPSFPTFASDIPVMVRIKKGEK